MELTPTDYILLAYLHAGPIHAYRLAEILKGDRIDSWVQYSIPHLYYSLRRLKKNGLVEVEIRPEKARPAKKIYSLTPAGRKLIGKLTLEKAAIGGEQYFPFDLILGFSEKLELNPARLTELIEARVEALNHSLANLQEAFRQKQLEVKQLSAGERIAFMHRIRFLKSEIDFYRKSIKEIRQA